MYSFLRPAAGVAIALTLMTSQGAIADTGAGAYLAGRQAVYNSDFEVAARFYARALSEDAQNPALMERVVQSRLALGDVDRALPVARQIEEAGLRSQAAHMAAVAGLIAEKNYETLLAREPEKLGIGPLIDGLLTGWAYLGTGAASKALEQFDEVAAQEELKGFALYHKALALASVGDFEGAEALFASEGGQLTTISRRAAIARAEILSQLDRNEDALAMMADVFGARTDPGLDLVIERLEAGERLPFSLARNAQEGMAEVFFTIGAALSGEAADNYSLIYIRTASYLRPDHIDALLLSADLLEDLGQLDLAVDLYKKVPASSPDHHAAELGRAEALRRSAKPDAAIEVLEQLSVDYPEQPMVFSSLGDLLRQEEKYAAAVSAYDRALELTGDEDPGLWFVLYARGISHERLDKWELAEADFRRALELNPEQPQVLNYLGYSLVEKQIKLDEALDMIERAVAGRPDSGYIVDSLGWVLFRLGRYDEAVGHMEKAVELMPIDPVVNDHLGDVYWAVGRTREAEFQWKRALSFIDPEESDGEADPERIRRKIEVGLDAVLSEEGAEPLQVAHDG